MPPYWQRHTMRMIVGFALLEVEALGSLPSTRILLEVPTTSKTGQVRTHRTRVGKWVSSQCQLPNLHGRLVRGMFHIHKDIQIVYPIDIATIIEESDEILSGYTRVPGYRLGLLKVS